MKHWTLHISPNQIRPLLDQPTIEKLQDDYLDKMKATYTEWLKNLLNLEMRDWKSPTNKPEMDENQKFQTTAPKGVWYFQNKSSKTFFDVVSQHTSSITTGWSLSKRISQSQLFP